ncbi:MAG: xylulokinase [Lysobacterales bacterium]
MGQVLGIDLGTQALKVLVYDAEGKRTIAVETASLDLDQSSSGAAEQQAHWWLQALRQALSKVPQKERLAVQAIAVSGQQHGFVALNAANEVIAPVKLWCDTSTQPQCDDITRDFGGREAVIEQLGNPLLAGYTASKVRWLKEASPEVYRYLDGILLPHDYLNLYLTGNRCMEVGDASGTGFFDIAKRQWSKAMLSAVDPDRDLQAMLPTPRHTNEPVGSLIQVAADELGLPAGIPVAIGGGDNMMGAIGTGNVGKGRLTLSLGTSGTVYGHCDQPVIDPKGNIAAFCSSTGGWLPLLCTMNCTVTTELMRRLLATDIEDFEQRVAQAPLGSDGVITVPFFGGERTPNLPKGQGCILGLNSRNMLPNNLLRSAMEGATFALKFGIEELASLGVAANEIVLTGGGANSAQWRQLVANVCNAPVAVFKDNEGAAFGAAMQALQLLTPDSDIASIVDDHLVTDPGRCCEPESAAVDDYAKHYQPYQQAVDAITTLYR